MTDWISFVFSLVHSKIPMTLVFMFCSVVFKLSIRVESVLHAKTVCKFILPYVEDKQLLSEISVVIGKCQTSVYLRSILCLDCLLSLTQFLAERQF